MPYSFRQRAIWFKLPPIFPYSAVNFPTADNNSSLTGETVITGRIYTALLLSGKLDSHLSKVDAQAKAMFFQLVKRLEKREGITEQLKAEGQMEWVRQMNSARNRAEEVIYNELIYA